MKVRWSFSSNMKTLSSQVNFFGPTSKGLYTLRRNIKLVSSPPFNVPVASCPVLSREDRTKRSLLGRFATDTGGEVFTDRA